MCSSFVLFKLFLQEGARLLSTSKFEVTTFALLALFVTKTIILSRAICLHLLGEAINAEGMRLVVHRGGTGSHNEVVGDVVGAYLELYFWFRLFVAPSGGLLHANKIKSKVL
jgi:hypothetical protein